MTHDTSNGGDDDAPPSVNSGVFDGDSHATDALFEAMANRRARLVLSHFDSVSMDVCDLDDLADDLAEQEVEAGMADDPEDCRERVAVDLHHNHLPRLDEAGLVEYDARSNTVRYRDDERIATCLELFELAKRS